jgi:transcriptional regulator with XRE-family HTH domain
LDFIQVVADRISRLILQRGYPSVERFAYENGLDKSSLSKILKGKRRPRFDTMIRIAEALDVTLNDFYLPEGALVREKGEIRYSASRRIRSPRGKSGAQ